MIKRNEALKAMREGKHIGFETIPGVEMYIRGGFFMFKHKCGMLEKLDERTLDSEDGYVILDTFKPSYKTARKLKGV